MPTSPLAPAWQISRVENSPPIAGGLGYLLQYPRLTGWLTLAPEGSGWPTVATGQRVAVLPGLPTMPPDRCSAVPLAEPLRVHGVTICSIAPMAVENALRICDGDHAHAWSHNVRRVTTTVSGSERAPDATACVVVQLAAEIVRDFASRDDFADRVHQVDVDRAPGRTRALELDLDVACAERDAWQQHVDRLDGLLEQQRCVVAGRDAARPAPWPELHDPQRSLDRHVRAGGRDSEYYLRRSGTADHSFLSGEPR
ncbi:hypothetical protein [Flexivirga caeni]|uniref:hypothetical protein n=1 Tax=Flexivirga caeni TaxID=2294115 RepID=UPI0011CD87B9|nr:hypothetical protein [Flexivirga caeni]